MNMQALTKYVKEFVERNNIVNKRTTYELITITSRDGWNTAIVKTTFGFVLFQISPFSKSEKDIKDIWLDDNEFLTMKLCKVIPIKPKAESIKPIDIDLETMG